MHPQTPSDPFLFAWSLPLSSTLLFCCLVSGPPVNFHSALFPPPVSAHNYLAPPCTPNALLLFSPIICCRGEREGGLWREHRGTPSSLSISLWGLPGEKERWLQGSFWAPEKSLQLEAVAEPLACVSVYPLSRNYSECSRSWLSSFPLMCLAAFGQGSFRGNR